jgi:hypothetical protein
MGLRSPECVANKMFNCATKFYPEITSMQPFVECWIKETEGTIAESYIGLLAYGQRCAPIVTGHDLRY